MAERGFYTKEMALQQERLAATSDMKAQRELMLDLLCLKPGEAVLDIGSGNGIFAREMAELVGASGQVCGADTAEPMVEMSKSICPACDFRQADATCLPFENDCFDAVTASQLLCFVKDADGAVVEMYRVLKPGGRLVILDSDWGSLVWNCSDHDLMERSIKMFTGPYSDAHVPRTLSRRLAAAGFEITDRRTHTVLNWDPHPESYSQQTVGFIEPMMKASDEFTDADWNAWIADQRATADAGEFFFSLNRYLFSARKP
jgi:ubiquinone/menaquinone biosynthesis C-methylase UbiE